MRSREGGIVKVIGVGFSHFPDNSLYRFSCCFLSLCAWSLSSAVNTRFGSGLGLVVEVSILDVASFCCPFLALPGTACACASKVNRGVPAVKDSSDSSLRIRSACFMILSFALAMLCTDTDSCKLSSISKSDRPGGNEGCISCDEGVHAALHTSI